MASKLFDTDKIISDIKAGKITSKEPPKYIFVKNPRNNTKKKKLNPRWTAWSNRQKNKRIEKDVESYVKKRKGPINKDLTIDNSKKKKVVKKTNNTQQTNTSKTETPKTETPKTETPKTEVKKVKKKESRFIRNPKTKTLVRRTSQKGKQLLKIQARKDALIKKRFGDKKKKKS